MPKLHPCPCCGAVLGPQQIDQHLAALVQPQLYDTQTISSSSIGAKNDLGDPTSMAGGSGHIELAEPKDISRVVQLQQDQIPALEAVPMQLNPPVDMQYWADTESDFVGLDNDLDNDLDDGLGNFSDNKPIAGASPEDKPLMDNGMLRAFLEMHLGDQAEDKWLDLSLETCPICHKRRFSPGGRPRWIFHYTPLIPQLRALFHNPEMTKKLPYCLMAKELHTPGTIEDVFNSKNYCCLRTTLLNKTQGYHYFDNPTDIALGILTDGFTLFKWRQRGHSTAWPRLIINYNLHPSSRTRLENLICVGVIPGPKQCKDINSFLVPLLKELLDLEAGIMLVQTTKSNAISCDPNMPGSHFILRAFLITIIGNIPAISKLLCMKGHNAKSPCRMCYIQGTLCQLAQNSVYYVPLTTLDVAQEVSLENLVLCTHDLFLANYKAIKQAPTPAVQQELVKLYGLNAWPIFLHLKSIDLATCAPYDAMHLLFKNLVPNMIQHWFGKFKGLDEGSGNYFISENNRKAIGELTVKAVPTTPLYFVGTLPDIYKDCSLYKAKAYLYWFQHLGVVLLKGRLPNVYYEHYLLIQDIINMVLHFEITYNELNKLEQMVKQWQALARVYSNRYYYQYKSTRLPTCPLTIHALLHMPHTIRKAGPLWTSWAFVMERFCGHLLPAVKNCTQPYDHLDNYVQRRAQMQVVLLKYNLPSLAKPAVKYTCAHGKMISLREKIYAEFPTVVLGTPVNTWVQVNTQLTNQLTKYFGTVYQEMQLNGAALCARIDFNSLTQYGRFCLAGDGDRVRTASLINNSPDRGSRDNTFVWYNLLEDANANYQHRPEVPVRRTYYGRVLDIYYVEFIVDLGNPDNTREPYLLACVKECQTSGLDATLRGSPLVTYCRMSTPEIIHIESINAAVGRVNLGNNTWAIVDRSRNGARTQFVEENSADFD
ncbi:Transposase family tnp2, partial [Rhizoctonia solani]